MNSENLNEELSILQAGFLAETPEMFDEFNVRNTDFIKCHHAVLAPFLLLAEQFTDINSVTGRFILSELSKGHRLAGEFKAKAMYFYSLAKQDRKRAEAVAALDLFADYVAVNTKVKSTDATRSYFVDSHPDVLTAKEKEAFAEALLAKITGDYYHIYNAWTMAATLTYGKQQGELSEIPDGILKNDNLEVAHGK